MKFTEKQVSEIVSGDIQQIFDDFLLAIEEYPDKEKSYYYNRVRWGIDIKFDIYDYLHGERMINKVHHYIMYTPHTTKRMTVSIESFRTEIERRKTLMRKALYEQIQGGSIEPFDT